MTSPRSSGTQRAPGAIGEISRRCASAHTTRASAGIVGAMPRPILFAAFLAAFAVVGCANAPSDVEGSVALSSPVEYRAVVSAEGRVTVRSSASRVGLELRTRLLRRAQGLFVPDEARRVITEEATRVRVELGERVVERFAARNEGVEQSWHFDERPDGRGDLVVEVEVTSARFVRSDADGLLFATLDESLIRYGHATWIDARGERTHIPSRLDGDRILLRVPAAIVDGSPYPAVLDPIVGPAMPVDEARPAPSPGYTNANVFFDGTNYLITYRNAADVLHGVRVDSSGFPIDPVPFVLPPFLTIACDGTTCMGLLGDRTSGTRFRRFRTDGTLLEATEVMVDPIWVSADAVSYAGGFLLLWSEGDPDGTGDIVYRHYTTGGTPVEAEERRLDYPGSQIPHGAACGPANCLLAFFDDGSALETNTARIAHDGTALDTEALRVFDSVDPTGVVHDGTSYVVHKVDRAVRIGDDGTILTSPPLSLTTGGGSGACNTTRCMLAARSGVDYSVLEHASTTATRVSVSLGSSEPMRLACSATECVATSVRDTNVLEVRILDATGAIVRGPFGVGGSVSPQARPALATDGTHYLATWSETRASQPGVYAARIDPTMGTLDPMAITVAAADHDSPAVAFGGGTYMVAMHRISGGISVARVGPTGSSPDASSPAYVSSSGTAPRIVFDGTNFMIVFRDGMNRIAVTRVNAVGALVGAGPTVVNPGGFDPHIAFDGTNHLVTWSAYSSARSEEVYGIRVARDGSAVDAAAFPIASELGGQYFARVAFGGGTYLVVWFDGRHSGESAVYGARVDPSGVVADLTGIPIVRLPGASGDIAVTGVDVSWDGASFVVTWLERHLREYPPGSGTTQEVVDVMATRVASDGSVIDPSPTIIESNARDADTRTAAASRRAGETMIAYEGRVSDVDRVMVRLFTAGAPGVSCTAPSDCDSGYCVDGVCCDSACAGACDACSIASGAASDGVCGVVPDCTIDAGVGEDGGMTESDGGIPEDAGTSDDGGVALDGGTTTDAGPPPPGSRDSGCSCHVAAARAPNALFAIGVVFVLLGRSVARRRRR